MLAPDADAAWSVHPRFGLLAERNQNSGRSSKDSGNCHTREKKRGVELMFAAEELNAHK